MTAGFCIKTHGFKSKKSLAVAKGFEVYGKKRNWVMSIFKYENRIKAIEPGSLYSPTSIAPNLRFGWSIFLALPVLGF